MEENDFFSQATLYRDPAFVKLSFVKGGSITHLVKRVGPPKRANCHTSGCLCTLLSNH